MTGLCMLIKEGGLGGLCQRSILSYGQRLTIPGRLTEPRNDRAQQPTAECALGPTVLRNLLCPANDCAHGITMPRDSWCPRADRTLEQLLSESL